MTKAQSADASGVRVSLATFRARKRDEASIIIDTGDDEFVVDPPVLWSDEALAMLAANDIVGASRAILGDRYDAFCAAGGSAATLAAIIEEAAGAAPGE